MSTAPSYSESVLQFACEGESMLGIVSLPANNPVPQAGVIIVVGGPQYRVGSHRQFVLLARALASAGMAVLRFDCRGMGDSGGAQRSFTALDADIRAAVDALQSRLPSLESLSLWGLCDGASAALLYQGRSSDVRVKRLCLANPWVRSEATLARTQIKHYYTARLRQPEFWKKLLSGKVALKALRDIVGNLRAVRASGGKAGGGASKTFQQAMGEGWQRFPGPILLMLSAEDYVAKEFIEHTQADPAWTAALAQRPPTRHDLIGIDHTFSDAASRKQVEDLTAKWLTV